MKEILIKVTHGDTPIQITREVLVDKRLSLKTRVLYSLLQIILDAQDNGLLLCEIDGTLTPPNQLVTLSSLHSQLAFLATKGNFYSRVTEQ